MCDYSLQNVKSRAAKVGDAVAQASGAVTALRGKKR
jgi:hypothetical protein